MKSFKEWLLRWLNPVQVGDVWEWKSSDPFNNTHLVDTVLAVSDGYVRYERTYMCLGIKDIKSESIRQFTMISKLISEKQQ